MSERMPGGERRAIPNVVSIEDFRKRQADEGEKARKAEEARIAQELADADALLDFSGVHEDDGPHPDSFILPADKY